MKTRYLRLYYFSSLLIIIPLIIFELLAEKNPFLMYTPSFVTNTLIVLSGLFLIINIFLHIKKYNFEVNSIIFPKVFLIFYFMVFVLSLIMNNYLVIKYIHLVYYYFFVLFIYLLFSVYTFLSYDFKKKNK